MGRMRNTGFFQMSVSRLALDLTSLSLLSLRLTSLFTLSQTNLSLFTLSQTNLSPLSLDQPSLVFLLLGVSLVHPPLSWVEGINTCINILGLVWKGWCGASHVSPAETPSPAVALLSV
jgi:hypothetical protein